MRIINNLMLKLWNIFGKNSDPFTIVFQSLHRFVSTRIRCPLLSFILLLAPLALLAYSWEQISPYSVGRTPVSVDPSRLWVKVWGLKIQQLQEQRKLESSSPACDKRYPPSNSNHPWSAPMRILNVKRSDSRSSKEHCRISRLDLIYIYIKSYLFFFKSLQKVFVLALQFNCMIIKSNLVVEMYQLSKTPYSISVIGRP